MKAYKIIVTRTLAESVELTIPGDSSDKALEHLGAIGLEQAIEDYAAKDDGGDYPAWEFDDYTGDPYVQENEPPKEVWKCDKCGEVRDLDQIQHHLDVCHMFAQPPAGK